MDAARKILAIDDNPSIRSSMRFIFPGPRYQVTDVEDVDDALARLSASDNHYDVIIVDQKMPRLSGLELGTRDQATGHYRENYGPVSTSHSRDTGGLRANECGVATRQAL